MFTVKIRDHITARTRALAPARTLALLQHDDNKWRSCVFAYKTYELALAFVNKQIAQAGSDRFGILRDHRIFEQEGRKQKLVYEHLAEKEGE